MTPKKPKAVEIFKVQVALYGGDMCLAYNKDRSAMGEFPTTKDVRRLMGGKMKKFFYCKPGEGGKPLEIIEEAPWQDW